MAKQDLPKAIGIIHPNDASLTNGRVIGPSATALPAAPVAPVRPTTPTKK